MYIIIVISNLRISIIFIHAVLYGRLNQISKDLMDNNRICLETEITFNHFKRRTVDLKSVILDTDSFQNFSNYTEMGN